MVLEMITMILSLLCGVSLFLFGMSQMGDGLKNAAGDKLEAFLYKMTKTPLKGVLLGTVVTSVIQSSSATTVMVIGFVNAGMMQLRQAIGIVMGANIGTSITGWILCLSYIEGTGGVASLLSSATIAAVVAIAGTLLKMLSKRSAYKNLANIMLGFAILMVGMQMMSSAVSPLRENAAFTGALTMFSNPVLGILLGIVMTAILYSSGPLRHRRPDICNDISGDTRRRCRRGLPGYDLFHRRQQERQAHRPGLSAGRCVRDGDLGNRILQPERHFSFFVYGQDDESGDDRCDQFHFPYRDRLHPVSVHFED